MPLSDPLPFISSALAPVVSLSVCAILASNAQSQYSSLVDRLRKLNTERLGYQELGELSEGQTQRLKSLAHQIPVLFRRTRLLRNAIFLLFLGMMFILLTSFMIVSNATFQLEQLSVASKWTFFLGLLFVFLALVTMLNEVFLTFRVVKYELGIFDKQAAKDAEWEYPS